MMTVLPVLDLMAGRVVRGVAGRRAEYRPVVSRLTPSSEPLGVARAFAEHLGLTELYLADLDALAGKPPAWATYAALRAEGIRLWVDAGVRGRPDVDRLAAAGVEGLVVGLETAEGPAVLADAVAAHGRRVVFSLDVRGGAPLRTAGWRGADAWSLTDEAVSIGVTRLLVLDLARVGVGEGIGTEALCARLAAACPDVEVYAGGGVRDVTDLRRLRDAGVRGALVASALHDGRLRRADIDGL
jgi:phosphoribosylformimino-5-aminoimidazole carboxamide ribotide isomerase